MNSVKQDYIAKFRDSEAMKKNDEDMDVVQTQGNQPKLVLKLFSFHENRRPPYKGVHLGNKSVIFTGSWQKKSKVVSARTPFARDETIDYECDSDAEFDDTQGEDIWDHPEEKEEVEEEETEADKGVSILH